MIICWLLLFRFSTIQDEYECLCFDAFGFGLETISHKMHKMGLLTDCSSFLYLNRKTSMVQVAARASEKGAIVILPSTGSVKVEVALQK